jgi:(2Fe-2S) ferredoxin
MRVLDLVIGFIGYSQVVTTINYNTLKTSVTVTHKVFNICLRSRCLFSRILSLDLWISEWTDFMRTECRSPRRAVYCSLLFSGAMKKVWQFLGNASIHTSVFVAAETCLANHYNGNIVTVYKSGHWSTQIEEPTIKKISPHNILPKGSSNENSSI